MVRKLLIGLLILCNVLAVGAVLIPRPVYAATSAECTGNGSIPIIPKWYKYLQKRYNAATATCEIDDDTNANNRFNFARGIPAVLLAVFEIILRITGIAAVIFVVFGGFQYLTSTGEPDKAKNARTTIINALVGLLIAMLSTVIVNLVGNNIG